ncbi:sensor histidine kinase [Arthrobacter castelli]|uniref:sensor histidine kinase n=1 Tax=Arthrobacter castelli TaxID=271431 RepID=UPI000684D536|nr:sensor histidine kinase [Arthrobacter castelli]
MSARQDRAERMRPDRSVWVGGMKWWHAAFYVVLTTAVLIIVGYDGSGIEKIPMLLALAGLGVVYPFLTRHRNLRTWKPKAYLVLLTAVVILLVSQGGVGMVILFVAFPQMWMFAGTARGGVAFTAILCIGVGAAQLQFWNESEISLSGAVVQAATTFVASTMLGLWIYKIIAQSEDRGELLAELEAARTELTASYREQGAMAERERISREIHDTLAQGFTSIIMLTEAAQAQLRKESPGSGATALEQQLQGIQSTARSSLQEARSLIAATGPAPLQGADLLDALARLEESFADDPGADLVLTLPGSLPPLSSVQQIAILRTAQEALNNVRRHSSAEHVTLRLEAPDRRLTLLIHDDGDGFDPGTATHGFGLEGMAARLDEIGARLDLQSAPGEGTTVSATVPLDLHPQRQPAQVGNA